MKWLAAFTLQITSSLDSVRAAAAGLPVDPLEIRVAQVIVAAVVAAVVAVVVERR